MSRDAPWPWRALGLDGPTDTRAVKRAYARCLKAIDRTDPDAFHDLLGAFEEAKRRAVKADETPPPRPSIGALIDAALDTPWPPDRDSAAGAPSAPEQPSPSERAKASPAAERTPAPSDIPFPVWHVRRDGGADTAPRPATETSDPPDTTAHAGQAGRWATPADTVQAEGDEDAAWWATFETALSARKTKRLDDLLSRPIANRDPATRHAAERRLFQTLSPSRPMSKKMATLLDKQFDWSRDGLGLRRRLGDEEGFLPILHAFSVAAATDQPIFKKTTANLVGAIKVGLFVLSWTILVVTERLDPTETVPLGKTVEESFYRTVVAFVVLGLLLRGLFAVVAWFGRLTGLTRRLAALPPVRALPPVARHVIARTWSWVYTSIVLAMSVLHD